MIKIKLFGLGFFLLALTSCVSKSDSEKLENEKVEIKKPTIEPLEKPIQIQKATFPKVKNVADLKKTDFIPTLESSFKTGNNIIYGATMPFAWNEIKNFIGTPLNNFTSEELKKLNETKSFLNVLKENEYKTAVKFDGIEITAEAYLKNSLPFEMALTKFNKTLKFDKSEVESFGFWTSSSYARINYFKNEDNFSISLFPENKEHEIILIMNQKVKNASADFTQYLKILNQEKNQNIHFNMGDKVEIPIIEFNIEKKFSKLVGSKFFSETTMFKIKKAYQQNAFILNENGAEIYSEVQIAAEASAEVGFEKPKPKPKPKMMIFNKPFVVFLKRIDAINPYFGVYIANDELLKK